VRFPSNFYSDVSLNMVLHLLLHCFTRFLFAIASYLLLFYFIRFIARSVHFPRNARSPPPCDFNPPAFLNFRPLEKRIASRIICEPFCLCFMIRYMIRYIQIQDALAVTEIGKRRINRHSGAHIVHSPVILI